MVIKRYIYLKNTMNIYITQMYLNRILSLKVNLLKAYYAWHWSKVFCMKTALYELSHLNLTIVL